MISWILYISYMAAEKPKILITLEDSLLAQIDDHRFENRINSRSEAIRQLIEAGLGVSGSSNVKTKNMGTRASKSPVKEN